MSTSRPIHRRRFLMIAGGAVATSILLCSGVTILANQTPHVNYIYASCGKENTVQTVLVAYAYVEPVHALLTPQSEAFFTGKIDIGNLNFMDRLIAKMVKAKDADLRNWPTIERWADQIVLT